MLALGSARAQTGTAPANEMPASMQAVAQHRAKLASTCRVVTPPNAQDLPIHVTTWGNSGPTVLLVHGGGHGGEGKINIGGGPSTFVHQEALAQMGWTVKRVDRPGFGESPSRGVDDMNADSIWIAKMLGDGSHLIGHSFGGGDALLAAGRRPEAVRSLILVEPGIGPLLVGDPQSASNPLIRQANTEANKTLMNAQSPGELAIATVRTFGTDEHGGPTAALLSLQGNPATAQSLGCAVLISRFASTEQFRAAADAVVRAKIPVLVISGGYNPGRDASDEEFARLLHGKYVVVKSPNHFIQQYNPEEFNRVVNDFMHAADSSRNQRSGE